MKNIHLAIKHFILAFIAFFYTPFKKLIPAQTFKYAAAGGFNTVFDIALFTFSYHYIFEKHNLSVGSFTLSPHMASLFFAFCFSLPSGFYLNRYIVFQESGLKSHHQLIRYLIVVMICVVLNTVFLKLFVDVFGWYATPSKILTTVLVIVFSYTAQTHFFFKTKKKPDVIG